MSGPSVLRVNGAEETADYRSAVSEIIRNILRDHETTLVEVAEKIDVSLGTISNAFNRRSDLSPVYLNRLGRVFGATYLTPYVRLCGGVVQPIQGGAHDILPLMLHTGAEIAEARCVSSPGGVTETLRERLGYLPRLRRLHREMGELICEIEGERREAEAA